MDLASALIGAVALIITGGFTVMIWAVGKRGGSNPAKQVGDVAEVWEQWVDWLRAQLEDTQRRLRDCEDRERRRRTT